jgi:hypothetical protein
MLTIPSSIGCSGKVRFASIFMLTRAMVMTSSPFLQHRPQVIDNQEIVGGLALEFFRRNTAYYDNGTSTSVEQIVWDVEPHVAETIFWEMLNSSGVTVIPWAAVAAVKRNGSTLTSVFDVNKRQFSAKVKITSLATRMCSRGY